MEKYYWDTEFDTANSTMIHTFSNRVKTVVDFANCTISVVRDGVKLYWFSIEEGYTLTDYENFLNQTAKAAKELEAL
jgi:hypothetical protein